MAGSDVIDKIFNKMDADRSGSICESELSSAFKDFDQDGICFIRLISVFYTNGKLLLSYQIETRSHFHLLFMCPVSP